MSLVRYFLNNEDQNPTNIKYLHSLLALPVPRLIKEKEILAQRADYLESQIKSQAVYESKEFVQALGNTKNLLQLESGLLTTLKRCQEETQKFQQEIYQQNEVIEKIVKEQQKIEHISNTQGIITEILEIPQLLKNLINSKHYKDALQLIDYIEKIEVKEKIFKNIIESGLNSKKRLEEDLIEIISDSFDTIKTKEMLGYLSILKKLDKTSEIQEFLKCKNLYFNKILKKNAIPKTSHITLLSFLYEFLQKFQALYIFLFSNSEQALISFYLDIITNILSIFQSNSLSSISEISEAYQKVLEINNNIFIPYGCNILPEINEIIIESVTQKLMFYYNKTLINFENLIKLYGWESSGAKDNPLLEFGSLAVLFNNSLTIINEIRYFLCRRFPLIEAKELFFKEMENLFKKSAEIILDKAKNLIGNDNLTKQQLVIKGLMYKYVDVIYN